MTSHPSRENEVINLDHFLYTDPTPKNNTQNDEELVARPLQDAEEQLKNWQQNEASQSNSGFLTGTSTKDNFSPNTKAQTLPEYLQSQTQTLQHKEDTAHMSHMSTQAYPAQQDDRQNQKSLADDLQAFSLQGTANQEGETNASNASGRKPFPRKIIKQLAADIIQHRRKKNKHTGSPEAEYLKAESFAIDKEILENLAKIDNTTTSSALAQSHDTESNSIEDPPIFSQHAFDTNLTANTNTGTSNANTMSLANDTSPRNPEPAREDTANTAVVSKPTPENTDIYPEELKKMISYLDDLFDHLPATVIKDFSNSDYYPLYQKILKKLGLH